MATPPEMRLAMTAHDGTEPERGKVSDEPSKAIDLSTVMADLNEGELDLDRINSLEKRIESVGLWNPIHLESSYAVVEDEQDQHVVGALDNLGVEELEVVYSSETHHLAVPLEKYSINDNLARKAAKLHQSGKAATADYIVTFIEERIYHLLPDSEHPPNGNDGNVPVKLLNILDNVTRGDRDQEWPYDAAVKDELEVLLDTIDLSPSRAREYAQAYLNSTEADLEAFHDGDISIEMLNVRRRIRDSEIADQYKEALLEWSDTGRFNAPQLEKLLSIAETDFQEILHEVGRDNISPAQANQIATEATKKELSASECHTLITKIQRQEKDIDEYLATKLPTELDERFQNIIDGDWLDEQKVERYRKEIASRHESGEDTEDILTELEDRKEAHFDLPALPDKISEQRYDDELGWALSTEKNKDAREQLQTADEPEDTFKELIQKYHDERTQATSKEERLEARLHDVHTCSDAVWAQSLAERDPTVHKAVPLVDQKNGNIQVFFHKAQPTDEHDGMGEEIADTTVDLFFFSPPYYTQRGMKLDYLQEVESVDDPQNDLTEAEIDAGFEVYLNQMMNIFQSVYDKLKGHRYFLLNVSDHQVEVDGPAPNKRYPISEYLVSQIHTELNRDLPANQPNLQYVGRISWYKTFSGVERASLFFENQQTRGLPLYYYPEDRVEDIYIFRKGDAEQDSVYSEVMDRFDQEFTSKDQFKNHLRWEDPRSLFTDAYPRGTTGNEFSDMYKTDFWVVRPSTNSHSAGFPLSLAKLVIQLFSLPGDRIVDPTVGFGTTLKAVQDVNQESPHRVKREGLGWEDFSGEHKGQRDYLEELTRVLSTKDDQPYSSF